MAGDLATQPLREEHQELMPEIDHLLKLADSVGEASPAALKQGVGQACEFLAGHLLPHAGAEDRVLYPVVARLIGGPMATATMSQDHAEVERLTGELEALRAKLATNKPDLAAQRDLRRVLYSLHAIVKLHVAEEEEIFLPLMDSRLTAAEARKTMEQMHAAAREIKSKAGGGRRHSKGEQSEKHRH